MQRIRRGWVAAILTAAAVLAGCSTTPAGDQDQPRLNAAERDGDAEGAAAVDPDAKGSPPEAFTVPGKSVQVDVRSLKAPPVKKERPEVEGELRETGTDNAGPQAAVQTGAGVAAAPAPVVNVKGLDFNTWGAGHPPDTNGAVGPNHFVQSVNTSIGISASRTGRGWRRSRSTISSPTAGRRSVTRTMAATRR